MGQGFGYPRFQLGLLLVLSHQVAQVDAAFAKQTQVQFANG